MALWCGQAFFFSLPAPRSGTPEHTLPISHPSPTPAGSQPLSLAGRLLPWLKVEPHAQQLFCSAALPRGITPAATAWQAGGQSHSPCIRGKAQEPANPTTNLRLFQYLISHLTRVGRCAVMGAPRKPPLAEQHMVGQESPNAPRAQHLGWFTPHS